MEIFRDFKIEIDWIGFGMIVIFKLIGFQMDWIGDDFRILPPLLTTDC